MQKLFEYYIISIILFFHIFYNVKKKSLSQLHLNYSLVSLVSILVWFWFLVLVWFLFLGAVTKSRLQMTAELQYDR